MLSTNVDSMLFDAYVIERIKIIENYTIVGIRDKPLSEMVSNKSGTCRNEYLNSRELFAYQKKGLGVKSYLNNN